MPTTKADSEFLGLSFSTETLAETTNTILQCLDTPKATPYYIATVNLDYLLRAVNDTTFMDFIQLADIRIADGMPVLWMSRLAGHPIPERVAGSDLFPAILSDVAETETSVYLLGGQQETNDLAAQTLLETYPNLKLAGTDCPMIHIDGYTLDAEKSHNDDIMQKINDANPDILFICFGSPKAEVWFFHNHEKLNTKVAIGVGAAIDFVAGTVSRAPIWMQKTGLEWLFRLLQEPRRLFGRYFRNAFGLLFLIPKVLKQRRSK